MSRLRHRLRAVLVAPLVLLAAPGQTAGSGDLLVAPTRIVLNGSRGTEIILNNIGTEVATYRISVELRRMKEDGSLEQVEQPNSAEAAARDMILYAPRRVTLPPDQPQSIRLSARAPQGLPDGEYRAHLLFRAVPPPRPAVQTPADFKGIGFALTPIYGVTIPVIVRLGNLQAKAGISNVRLGKDADGQPTVTLDLDRNGQRSTYGEIRVLKAGIAEPIALQRGVAVYTEVSRRRVEIPVDARFADQARGPVTVQYVEVGDGVNDVIAETRTVLN